MFILRPEGGLSNHRHSVCVTWIHWLGMNRPENPVDACRGSGNPGPPAGSHTIVSESSLRQLIPADALPAADSGVVAF